MRLLTSALALCLLALPRLVPAQPPAAVEYELRDLGSVDDRGLTEALAINDRGEVVGGGLSASGVFVPFYWSRRTGFVKIFDDVQGTAVDINTKGEVVGFFARSGSVVGFLWSLESGLVELGPFHPTGINDRGDIAGSCESGSGMPCLISSEVIQRLQAPAGGFGTPISINERGDVVGTVNVGSSSDAALWRRGQQDFETLQPTSAAGFEHVIAYDINDRGLIIGTVEIFDGTTIRWHPVIWNRDGSFTLFEWLFGQATNINNHGVVTVMGDSPPRTLAWDVRRGTISVLPSLGGLNAQPFAYDINNHGHIAGSADTAQGEIHAVVWEPKKGRGGDDRD